MLRLAYNVFRPQGEVRGAVAVVHGMAEHRKRYNELAAFLTDNGYGVVTYDLPGHGESAEGELGHFGEDGWRTLVSSAMRAVKRARKEFPDVPVILLGHSMGSMIARCFIQEHDDEIDGLILSGAPNWQRAVNAGILLAKRIKKRRGGKSASKLLDRLVTGNFNRSVKNPKTDVDWLSYDEANVQEYIEDPLCGFGFTVQGYLDELEGMRQMHEVKLYQVKNRQLPIVFLAGGEDPCIGGTEGFKDSTDTLRNAGYRNITTRLYPKMRHEILRETNHERVYRDILRWLEKTQQKKEG